MDSPRVYWPVLKRYVNTKKEMCFWHRPWTVPLAITIEIAVIIGVLWLVFKVVPGPLRIHDEIKPTIEQFTAGDTKIIDLRSGAEITRIIIPPNGPAVVERVSANTVGEQDVRLTSPSR